MEEDPDAKAVTTLCRGLARLIELDVSDKKLEKYIEKLQLICSGSLSSEVTNYYNYILSPIECLSSILRLPHFLPKLRSSYSDAHDICRCILGLQEIPYACNEALSTLIPDLLIQLPEDDACQLLDSLWKHEEFIQSGIMASKLTNEEIARQFQLPERKSKLKSLLKQEREEYCLCRSSDTTRFMIGCDACEDWFHGDCIGISEKESKMIKLYYCQACRVEDPTLKILYRPGRKLEHRSYEDDDDEVSFSVRRKSPEPMKRKGEDVPGFGKRPKSLKQATKLLGKPPEKKSTWKRTRSLSHRGRRSGRAARSDSDSDYADEPIEREPADHSVYVSNVGSAYKDNMQCYGPGCVNVARKDSKYCSDNCGLKLATNRLLHILPHRVHDWTQTESVAEKFAFDLLNEYRQAEAKAKEELRNLDAKNEKLNEAIKRAKEFTVDPNYTKSASEEADTTLYCITCGHEIHVRTALKHMDKCYNKYEGQSTFGSLYKTKIEGSNMFCDFFNPSNRTYCKRLRVLCPEHYKEPKVGKDEICGCPLVVDVFTETGEICKNPKKDCSRHFGWEKMRQAEIDMERVRQWLSIDELSEKIRHLMQRVSGKVGTLPLLLHSTYDHDLKEKMSPEEDQKLLKSLEASLVSRYGRKDRLSKLQ